MSTMLRNLFAVFAVASVASTAPAAVPEPASFALAIIGTTAIAVWTCRPSGRTVNRDIEFAIFAVLTFVGLATCTSAADFSHTVDNPTPEVNDGFGKSLAVSGNYLVVGAPSDNSLATDVGAAYLYDVTNGNLLHTLGNPNPTNPSAFADDNFGSSVAISGNYIVVGALGEDIGSSITQAAVGKAYVFDAALGSLVRTFENPAPNFSDLFGTSVAISGTKALIGAPGDDFGATDSGLAYLFDAATGGALHSFINPSPETTDNFGNAVAIDGNYVAIGAPGDNSGANDAGAAYLFDATTFGLLRPFTNPNPVAGDKFGSAVAVRENLVLIGAPEVDRPDQGNSVQVGAAYLYDATTGALLHTFVSPDPRDELGSASNGERFGNSVAVDGNMILIGAPGDDHSRGAVYVFDSASGALLDSITDPTPASLESFGSSVGLSNNMFFCGVPGGTGLVQVYNAAAPVLLGDYNGNGVVDVADYIVWRKGLGTTYAQAAYDVWRSRFGQTIGSGVTFVGPTVPEPAAIFFALLTAAAMAFFPRRRQVML